MSPLQIAFNGEVNRRNEKKSKKTNEQPNEQPEPLLPADNADHATYGDDPQEAGNDDRNCKIPAAFWQWNQKTRRGTANRQPYRSSENLAQAELIRPVIMPSPRQFRKRHRPHEAILVFAHRN